ncbi:MAG: AAA family ATPase [Candidatus Caldarchaeales archaeon]
MRVLGLRLKDFLSHRETELAFSDGLTAIVGENGSGKTSLLDAITFALFMDHSRGYLRNLINRRSSRAIVELRFSSGGREYEVETTIERKGESAEARATLRDLTSGTTLLVDAGRRSLVPEIERLTGMTAETFVNAVYVRQGEIARLLDATPADRKRMIAELLGTEVLERIWETLKDPIGKWEAKLEAYEKEAERVPQLEEELGKVRSESEEVRGRLEALRSELGSLEVRRSEAERRLEELESKRRLFESLSERRRRLEDEIELARQRLRDLDERISTLDDAERRLSEHRAGHERHVRLSEEVKELEARRGRLREALGRLASLEAELERRRSEASRAESDVLKSAKALGSIIGEEVDVEGFEGKRAMLLSRLEEAEAELEGELRSVDSRAGELEGLVKTYEGYLEDLERAGDVCPLCSQPLTPDHRLRLVEGFRGSIARAEDDLRSLKVRRSSLERRLRETRKRREEALKTAEAFRSALERLNAARSRSSEIEAELSGLQGVRRELEGLEREIAAKRSELEATRRDHDEYLRVEGTLKGLGRRDELLTGRNRFEAELREHREELKSVEARLAELGYDESELEMARRSLEDLKERISEVSRETARLEERLRSLGEWEARIAGELNRARSSRSRAEELRRELEVLRALRECFGKDGAQRALRSKAKRTIEQHARRFLQAFNLAYGDVRLDDDYGVYLYGPEGEQPLESLSGGERMAVALSLRLAIAAALAGDRMECLIMDEPTVHLDAERRRQLVRLLEGFRRERGAVPQAIVVTHDREVEEVADQLVEVVKEGGHSVVRASV